MEASGRRARNCLLAVLILAYKDKHDIEQATRIAFRGVDLDRFETEWLAFFEGIDLREAFRDIHRRLTGQAGRPRH